MPKKKLRFINKSNSTTYKLIPGTNNDANQEAVKRHEEQLKHGVFYDDDYDYLQHLRTRSDKSDQHDFIALHGHVDHYQDDQGLDPPPSLMTHQHPPNSELDADILAALEGEVEVGDEIEDDFCTLANHGVNEDKSVEDISEEGYDDDGGHDDDDGGGHDDDDGGGHDDGGGGGHDNDDDGLYMNDDDDGDDDDGDDDDGDDDDGDVTTNKKMSEQEFQEYYEKFKNDDVDFSTHLDRPDNETVAKTLDLLAIGSKKTIVTFNEADGEKAVVRRVVGGGREETEMVTIVTPNRDVNIANVVGLSKKSKHQPKTISINFDKKKKTKEKKSNG